MYCRLQGYLSPHLVVYVRYQDPRPIARGLVPVREVSQGGVEFCHVMVYVTQVVTIVVNVWSCLRLQFRRFPE